MNEVETYKDILNTQITTLQRYFDTCAESGGLQSLGEAQAIDFKGEAITFRETTNGVLTALGHCLDIIMQKEDGLKKKLEKETEKRKKVEEELKYV